VFTWPIRVYWEDTDAGQIVYHARYLHFMERARSEWLRSIGIEQDQVRDNSGVVFVVTASQLNWIKPARYNDELLVSVENVQIGKASLSFEQRIWRAGETPEAVLLSGNVRAAAVDAVSLKPVRIPAEVQQKFIQGAAALGAAE
jgi:acyl-CoA thioester hydrolase